MKKLKANSTKKTLGIETRFVKHTNPTISVFFKRIDQFLHKWWHLLRFAKSADVISVLKKAVAKLLSKYQFGFRKKFFLINSD